MVELNRTYAFIICIRNYWKSTAMYCTVQRVRWLQGENTTYYLFILISCVFFRVILFHYNAHSPTFNSIFKTFHIHFLESPSAPPSIFFYRSSWVKSVVCSIYWTGRSRMVKYLENTMRLPINLVCFGEYLHKNIHYPLIQPSLQQYQDT